MTQVEFSEMFLKPQQNSASGYQINMLIGALLASSGLRVGRAKCFWCTLSFENVAIALIR